MPILEFSKILDIKTAINLKYTWPISHIAAKFPCSVLDEQSFC